MTDDPEFLLHRLTLDPRFARYSVLIQKPNTFAIYSLFSLSSLSSLFCWERERAIRHIRHTRLLHLIEKSITSSSISRLPTFETYPINNNNTLFVPSATALARISNV